MTNLELYKLAKRALEALDAVTDDLAYAAKGASLEDVNLAYAEQASRDLNKLISEIRAAQ